MERRERRALRLARLGSAVRAPALDPAGPFPASATPPAERWLSGRKHRTRNAAYGQPYRGFESHPLRQFRVAAPGLSESRVIRSSAVCSRPNSGRERRIFCRIANTFGLLGSIPINAAIKQVLSISAAKRLCPVGRRRTKHRPNPPIYYYPKVRSVLFFCLIRGRDRHNCLV